MATTTLTAEKRRIPATSREDVIVPEKGLPLGQIIGN